jgi:predicted nucleic acid-binding protein
MILVDTSAWFASIVPSDTEHQAASSWVSHNTKPLLTTDYIIDETLTVLAMRSLEITASAIAFAISAIAFAILAIAFAISAIAFAILAIAFAISADSFAILARVFCSTEDFNTLLPKEI